MFFSKRCVVSRVVALLLCSFSVYGAGYTFPNTIQCLHRGIESTYMDGVGKVVDYEFIPVDKTQKTMITYVLEGVSGEKWEQSAKYLSVWKSTSGVHGRFSLTGQFAADWLKLTDNDHEHRGPIFLNMDTKKMFMPSSSDVNGGGIRSNYLVHDCKLL